MEDEKKRVILHSDKVVVNGTTRELTLTACGELSWSERRLDIKKEVLNICFDNNNNNSNSNSNSNVMMVKSVVEKERSSIMCYMGGSEDNATTKFVFEMENDEICRVWFDKIREIVNSLGRPKRLFVFVNPFGGNNSASKIFNDDVKPLLEDANIEYTVLETEHQLHAKEVALSLDLTNYDGIVCVSGDGILVEVINGLLEREDWADAIKMPIGVVPAGTGNGMVKSLLDAVGLPCTAFHATLAIIRGHTRSLDVATVLQGETKFFSVLMLAWGLVADIDIESEKYRWMGKARLDVYALQRIFFLRKYTGCISFVPAPGFEDFGEPSNLKEESMCKDNKVHQRGYLGPSIDLDSCNWRKFDGPFVSVWLHNVPWGSEDTKAAPDAKFSDGYLDLIVMRDCPKLGLLALMSEMGNGNHVKSPHVSYLKVKAFILEPGSRVEDPTKEGIVDVDGEVLARGKGAYKAELKALMNYDKLQLTVEQGLATIFTPI